jgi:ASF1 like histone chaperone
VGSAESEEYDQTLDTVVVGPIIAGRHMFVFEVIMLTVANILCEKLKVLCCSRFQMHIYQCNLYLAV